MLISFLDRLNGLFDRHFMVGQWAPASVALVLAGSIATVSIGSGRVLRWWTGLQPLEQTWLTLAALLAVTVLAYLLLALSNVSIRFYEGYTWPGWLASWSTRRQKARWARGEFHEFPRNTSLVRPTRLGNILTAAEEHPYQLYRLEAVAWWPRLTPVLPAEFRKQVDAALTPLLAWLNLSTMIVLLALVGGAVSLLSGQRWWASLSILAGGLLLARIFYAAAVAQAADYAVLIRVAFDLYRHELLKTMHIPVPDNLVEERLLWEVLNPWIHHYIPPWESEQSRVTDRSSPKSHYYPFHYDTQSAAPQPAAGLGIDGQSQAHPRIGKGRESAG
ncbi:MAG TPA: hypothetical protein VE685_20540 [Thermoanaerobaculia bacterium]|nr:hypothetical protein [Thermoanaerobaculia bacterium]